MTRNTILIILIALIINVRQGISQSTNVRAIGAIGFYNLENLFDTEDDADIRDEEYLPEGKNEWTEERYKEKVTNMAKVLGQMANGADVVGVVEVENRKVLEDLVAAPAMARHRYQIVHFDSPDGRGIDVALLYKPSAFKAFAFDKIQLKDNKNPDFKTRDMLWVKGLYHGDTLNVVVNHWPSRRGGKEDKRILAAQILRNKVDSVQKINPAAKIILMGDFNDDPSNKSVKKVLLAGGKLSKLAPNGLFNTSMATFKQGFGTLFYRGAWNLFDQIIVSQSLLKDNAAKYHYMDKSFSVFAPNWMRVPDGEYKGAPLRTFSYGVYQKGYSDHFPVYILITK